MNESIIPAFVRVARTHAGRTALEGAGQRFTYAELLVAVRRLAQALADAGVGPGDHVGIQLARAPEHVVAMLATWWLDAAWVPLDAEWPAARTALVLRELAPRVVIALAPGSWDCPTVTPHANTAPHERWVAPAASDLAYVLYTSGSTGAPKGVRVSHAGLCGVLRAQIRAFAMGPSSRVLQVLAFGFDASISDIGTALLAGATLVIDPGPLAAPRLVAALEGVTHVDLPPALLARIEPATLPIRLECVVVGGEVCPRDVLVAWARRVRVVVVYGPTEASICSSLVVVDPDAWSGPSIGRPIAGFSYTLDDGELVVRGPGVALGYVDRPDLQRARFASGGFRTGDRVRQHDDGSWEFVGRADRQRKVRGILVAPEEVEAVLAAHPRIERAAVLVRADRLVAFVVGALTASEVHEYVHPRLPRGLRPHYVELVTRLPETASGKVDAAALSRLPITVQDAPFSAPHAGVEATLAAIWSQALGVPVGRDSTFLALGGDSLAALEIVAAAEARGIAVPSEALYRGVPLAAIANGALEAEPCVASSLRADAAAERARLPAGVRRAAEPGGILLTGATGFFGARVLHELLATQAAPVVCLLRTGGLARIEAALAVHGLALRDPSRVLVVLGDAAAPNLGLAPATYDRLAADVGTIHHVAAAVNLVLPYARLYAANVVATRNVLAFAATGRAKHVQYASTLSVGACVAPLPTIFHEHDELEAELVHGGYAASKWAAEELVRMAADRVSVRCVRLGLLTGDSQTGRGSPTCQLVAFLRGLRALGGVPALDAELASTLRVDVTPVDYAARAFVALANLPEDAPGTFHLASERPATWSDLVAALDAVAAPLPRVSLAQLRARLGRATLDQALATTALAACRRLLDTSTRHVMSDLFLASDVRFDLARGQALGLHCPPARATLLASYAREALRMSTHGLVLGKFMPPHLGHLHLIEFAQSFVDELTVVVGTLAREPIDGALRHRWMSELAPAARVVHLTDENPQLPEQHTDFWGIWQRSLARVLPRPVDFVFASDAYGATLASVLGATFVPVDPARTELPVSGTAIRRDPFAHWEYLPRCVRPHYAKRISVFGPESTGKSTLVRALAAHFEATAVPEYARTWLELHAGRKVQPADMPIIARGQLASEAALARAAHRYLICDTDPLATRVWSELLFGAVDAALAPSNGYDLTLLLDVDVPWVGDGVRYLPDERKAAFDRFETALRGAQRNYVVVRGTWSQRLQRAIAAIQALA